MGNLKDTVSADQIKRLIEINESDVQGHNAVLCTSLVAVEGRIPRKRNAMDGAKVIASIRGTFDIEWGHRYGDTF